MHVQTEVEQQTLIDGDAIPWLCGRKHPVKRVGRRLPIHDDRASYFNI
jgi:hypothetical protein